jgi:uncharacterized protein YyaL (SSP411 family)
MSIRQAVKVYASLASPDIARAYLTMPRKKTRETAEALDAAMRWLCVAQDACGDGGVARSYSIAYHPFFRRRGWMPSYPETTGYIIPTMFEYARRTGRQEYFARAVRMTDWESDVQMPNGAVMGGTVDTRPTPAIFNTGQVLFGWVRAFQETRNERYLDSARRAGDFLLAAQDADGAWRKSLSDYASATMSSYTYNTRSAWGLFMLGEVSGRRLYCEAATRNIEYALTQQRANGWFASNCLSDPARPLLHTIAYSLRGVLEIGIAARNDRYISAARTAADALLRCQRADGSLPGRLDHEWQPAANFSCLTGNVQMGTVWARLYELTGDGKYLEGLIRANAFTRSVQWQGTGNPALDGAISGSFPLHGRYGRFEVLNWAVKFFADSLMLEADARIHRPMQTASAVAPARA